MRFHEQTFNRGVDEALADFGLTKIAIMSPQQRQKALEAYRARPKGMAAVQAAGQPSAGPAHVPPAAQQLQQLAGPASQVAMTNPAAPPVLPGGSGLELDRTGYQGGYGTAGRMPGAVMGARGQVVGLPNKLAAFKLARSA